MSKVWITSDTHFGHRSIFSDEKCPGRREWCGSTIEEHDSRLTQIWNNLVGADDLVIHLGDFAWGGVERVKAIRRQLNGKLWIALGNHDGASMTAWRKRICYPTDIVDLSLRFEYRGKKILCRHVPYAFTEDETEKHDELWHGHVHDRPYIPNTPKHRRWGIDNQIDLISCLGPRSDIF